MLPRLSTCAVLIALLTFGSAEAQDGRLRALLGKSAASSEDEVSYLAPVRVKDLYFAVHPRVFKQRDGGAIITMYLSVAREPVLDTNRPLTNTNISTILVLKRLHEQTVDADEMDFFRPDYVEKVKVRSDLLYITLESGRDLVVDTAKVPGIQ